MLIKAITNVQPMNSYKARHKFKFTSYLKQSFTDRMYTN